MPRNTTKSCERSKVNDETCCSKDLNIKMRNGKGRDFAIKRTRVYESYGKINILQINYLMTCNLV